MAEAPLVRPAPAANPAANVCAYCAGFLVFAGMVLVVGSPIAAAFVSLAITAVIIATHDIVVLGVHRRPSAGLGQMRAADSRRVLIKTIGLAATLAIVYGLSAWLLPLLGGSPTIVLAIYPLIFILILTAAPFYFHWMDRRMDVPEDATWHVGQLILGRWRSCDLGCVADYTKGWAIKAYFLPLMLGGLLNVATALGGLTDAPPQTMAETFLAMFKVLLFVDLTVAVLGYMMTFRVLDTHIRSCNPLLWGWVVTIVCYAPFWGYVAPVLFDYGDGMSWVDWFDNHPVALFFWGMAILLLRGFWAWSNCCFGLRFSNLTHRGILTSGPFGWTKHPSYISKNIGWWLISMPFLSAEGLQTALAASAALVGVNLVYLLRARAEERHLSEDPDYVAYALWMNRHGVFAPLGRVVPWLRYRSPEPFSARPVASS